MKPYCVALLALLAAAASAAAQEPPRAPDTIVVSPPAGGPPGVYRRVTPPREGEKGPAETYMQAAPSRDPADDDGLERARRAARRAKVPERPDLPSGTTCLSARDARGAIGSKRAVTLAQAARAARDAWDGEVIDYKLCSVEGLLTYDLTLLNADGKVARARVDAGTGKLVNVR